MLKPVTLACHRTTHLQLDLDRHGQFWIWYGLMLAPAVQRCTQLRLLRLRASGSNGVPTVCVSNSAQVLVVTQYSVVL